MCLNNWNSAIGRPAHIEHMTSTDLYFFSRLDNMLVLKTDEKKTLSMRKHAGSIVLFIVQYGTFKMTGYY